MSQHTCMHNLSTIYGIFFPASHELRLSLHSLTTPDVCRQWLWHHCRLFSDLIVGLLWKGMRVYVWVCLCIIVLKCVRILIWHWSGPVWFSGVMYVEKADTNGTTTSKLATEQLLNRSYMFHGIWKYYSWAWPSYFVMDQYALEMVSVWLKVNPKGNNLFQRTHHTKKPISNIQRNILDT